jgi:hypothetical protein
MKMRKSILLAATLTAGLWVGSSLDKEVLLYECVQQTEGTDADCEECYMKIYGHHSND